MDVEKAKEDYLEAILLIKIDQGYCRSVDIAKKLSVSKPSVTYSTKKLKEQDLITMDDNNMIFLTDKGEKLASKVYKRHKTLVDFFVSLGVSKKTAEDDACRVEHVISEETFNRILKSV